MESGPLSSIVLLIIPVLLIIGIAIWLVRSYIKNKDDNAVENRKASISTMLFVISGVPLLVYPLALIADIMMFNSPLSTISVDMILPLLWFVVSISYPVTYFVALSVYKKRKKLLCTFAPVIHFVIAILLFPTWLGFSMDNDKTETGQYKIYSVNIYKNTPAWDLALAVRNQKANKIAEIAKSKPKLLEYHDPIYGDTLLIWAVGTERYDAAEALLKAGVNPNATALKRGGETALHEAARFSYVDTEAKRDAKYVKLLLKYGADPNIGMVSSHNDDNERGMTPVMNSIGCGIEKTKALVEGGADINARTPTGMTAAIKALMWGEGGRTDPAKVYAYYLIAEKHADVRKPWLPKPDGTGGLTRLETVTFLRDWDREPGTEGYRMKMDIIK